MTNFEALKVCIEYFEKNRPECAEYIKECEAINQLEQLIKEIQGILDEREECE